uniref:CX domain-containing protein n=1 Tax=Romanomermis culicivorax TaxID=13658 RepID=A0A915JW22_ROMCU
MQLFLKFSFLLCIVVIFLVDAKRGGSGGGGGGSRGGGGGFGRGGGSPTGGGGSISRGGAVGGGGINAGPGRPVGGGGTFGANSGGFRPASGGFAPSRGLSTTSKVVLAGVAGAALGAGTYALISSANSRYRSPDTGLTYYYGDRYYSPSRSGIIKCTYKVPENDTKLNLYYDKNNSSKVTEIIYECRLNDQVCCGLECCPNPAITTAKREEKSGMSLIAILCIGLIGGVGYCVYSQVRKSAVQNENNYNDGQASYTVYPAQQQPQYQQQQAAYPTNQGWDGAAPAYSQQTGFYGEQQPPSYPTVTTHTPQSYPPGPPVQNYGFNAQSYPKYP